MQFSCADMSKIRITSVKKHDTIFNVPIKTFNIPIRRKISHLPYSSNWVRQLIN